MKKLKIKKITITKIIVNSNAKTSIGPLTGNGTRF